MRTQPLTDASPGPLLGLLSHAPGLWAWGSWLVFWFGVSRGMFA